MAFFSDAVSAAKYAVTDNIEVLQMCALGVGTIALSPFVLGAAALYGTLVSISKNWRSIMASLNPPEETSSVVAEWNKTKVANNNDVSVAQVCLLKTPSSSALNTANATEEKEANVAPLEDGVSLGM